uniref:Uncharacterized protein n=1 Tax=Romanomermis culicivorax TaxID=13658 RepID=A0A915J4L6_ROMCU
MSVCYKSFTEDAIRYENGRELHGSAICVEWAKGPNYRYDPRKEDDGYRRSSRRDDDRRRRRSRSRSRSGSYKRRS